MKYITLLQVALKYLYRYRRRYIFLFLALGFCFCVVTMVTSVKDGMYENVYNSAQSHYAGDIVVVGNRKMMLRSVFYLAKDSINKILQTIQNINPDRIVLRTHFSDKGVIYFNGKSVRMKYVIGVDWDNERAYFDSVQYRRRAKQSAAGDSIILSAPVAEELGINIGDSLVLEVDTISGWKNTGVFIVGGIAEDTTIFGYYKLYLSRVSLNRLLLYGDEDCSHIGFFFNGRKNIEQKRIKLQNALLSEGINLAPLVKDREELEREMNIPWLGVRAFIITIPIYLSEIADLLNAIDIVAYFLYGMMLLIIFASAGVTYRLILHERTRELGTMMAIGFNAYDVRFVLFIETFALGIMSLITGYIIALILNWASGFLSFSWFPSFEIFLKNGKLDALYLPKTIITNVVTSFCMLSLAAWIPVFNLSRNSLPQMLTAGGAS
jgi:ABC-type lipoprotein release transport system permease subunit